MKLIDADALNIHDVSPAYGMCVMGVTEEDIDDAPTIDAVPVRHGKWINMGDFEQCSVCTATHLKTIQTVYGEATWIKSDYCPNCGARMDAEAKDHGQNNS